LLESEIDQKTLELQEYGNIEINKVEDLYPETRGY